MKTISEFAFIKDGVQYMALAEGIDKVRRVFGRLDSASTALPGFNGHYPKEWDPNAHVRRIAIHPEYGIVERDDLRFAEWLADNGYKPLEHEAKPLKDDPENPCRNTDRNVDALRKRVERLEVAATQPNGDSMHSRHEERINDLQGRMTTHGNTLGKVQQSVKECVQNWDHFVPLNIRELLDEYDKRLSALESGDEVDVPSDDAEDLQRRLTAQIRANGDLVDHNNSLQAKIDGLIKANGILEQANQKLQERIVSIREALK